MNYIGEYAKFLRKFFRPAAPLKVVFDGSNGSTGPLVKAVFSGRPRLRFMLIHGRPDGRFPGHGPNPTFAFSRKDLERAVKHEGADLGVIFDADGDRAFFVDDKGRSVYADDAARLLALGFKPPYVIDVRTGRRFTREKKFLRSRRLFFVSRVGTFFMKKMMREKRANFGAENSGHYYFKYRFGENVSYFDSALRAAVEMMNRVSELKKKGNTLSAWLDALPPLHRSPEELNFPLKERRAVGRAVRLVLSGYRARALRVSCLDGVSIEMEETWFNVRASNTEPLIRVKIEAVTPAHLEAELVRLTEILSGL